jgi:CheY-like chemotaxis protein
MRSGPIILVDDDQEDFDIFTRSLHEIGVHNKVIWHQTCQECYDYLSMTSEFPFIIFCDVNMPVMSGLEFKQKVDATPRLRKKSIPFIFYSTSVDQTTVNRAYSDMTIQGFFQKAADLKEMQERLKCIISYWLECHHPNRR